MEKNKDDFVANRKMMYIKQFEYIFYEYTENTKVIKELEKKIDILLSELDNVCEVRRVLEIDTPNISYNRILAFKRLAQIHKVFENLVKDVPDPTNYKGSNLLTLFSWLNDYGKVKKYVYIIEELEERYKIDENIINKVDLSFNSECSNGHKFERIGNELRCKCCGISTKDYNFTEGQIDFLTYCASKKDLLVKVEEKIKKLDF